MGDDALGKTANLPFGLFDIWLVYLSVRLALLSLGGYETLLPPAAIFLV